LSNVCIRHTNYLFVDVDKYSDKLRTSACLRKPLNTNRNIT